MTEQVFLIFIPLQTFQLKSKMFASLLPNIFSGTQKVYFRSSESKLQTTVGKQLQSRPLSHF